MLITRIHTQCVQIEAGGLNSFLAIAATFVICWYDNLCKQFVPRSRCTEHWSGSKLFGFLIVFLKYLFEKIFWRKVSRGQKNIKKANVNSHDILYFQKVTLTQDRELKNQKYCYNISNQKKGDKGRKLTCLKKTLWMSWFQYIILNDLVKK